MMINRPPDNRESEQPQRKSGTSERSHEQSYGGRIGERLKDTGRSIVTEQKARACDELETISEVVHEAADKLHQRDDHLVAEYVDALADQIERASEYVRTSNISDLIDKVNEFARRHPEVVLGGALVIGLAAARFLKASAKPKSSSYGGTHFGGEQSHSEPFRGGVAQPGGGFETGTSEAGPIATTPRSLPTPTGTTSPGAGAASTSGAPMHQSTQRVDPDDASPRGGIDQSDAAGKESLGSAGPIGKSHYGEQNEPEDNR